MKRSKGDNSLPPTLNQSGNRVTWHPLVHRVVRTIRSRRLLQRGQHIVVGVSGGPDSVALLSILHHLRSSWKLTLTAVHCNYGLRGAESEEDQDFVEAFCRELGVALHVRRVELHSGRHTASVQSVARDLRYRVMQEIAERCAADRIAVGHTADDQAETVVLWMLRGAGLTGLAGMPAFRNDNVIRPLYETKRQDVLTYLSQAGLSFRQDSSNVKPRYLRNRIRHEVMPTLTHVVPSSVDALCRLADVCREDDRYLDQQVDAFCASIVKRASADEWSIELDALLELPQALQRRCIRHLFRQHHDRLWSPNMRTVDLIIRLAFEKVSGSRLDVKGGQVVIGDQRLRFISRQTPASAVTRPSRVGHQELLSVPGEILWAGTGQRLQVQQQRYHQISGPVGNDRILVDADRVSQPLMVRSWMSGDRFHPTGMGGHSKKLQDFFSDLKIPIAIRSLIPLVVAPEGILWVVGYRQDGRWMPSIATEHCLVFSIDYPTQREGTE